MPGQREYPPALLVHSPGCPDIPLPLRDQIEKTPVIAFSHPNAWMHNCYHFTTDKVGIVEPRYYPPHRHRPSTRWPDDAPVPTCEVCGGTHPGEPRGGIKVATPQLVVIQNPALQVESPAVLLPGNATPGEP